MKFCRKDTKSNPFKLGMMMKRANAIMAGLSSAEATFNHNILFLSSVWLKMLSTVWILDLSVIWQSDDSNIVISETKYSHHCDLTSK
jgi:hypothetical protein